MAQTTVTFASGDHLNEFGERGWVGAYDNANHQIPNSFTAQSGRTGYVQDLIVVSGGTVSVRVADTTTDAPLDLLSSWRSGGAITITIGSTDYVFTNPSRTGAGEYSFAGGAVGVSLYGALGSAVAGTVVFDDNALVVADIGIAGKGTAALPAGSAELSLLFVRGKGSAFLPAGLASMSLEEGISEFTFVANGRFQVPTKVTSIEVELVGGGGPGGITEWVG
ncbi:MAG: hypothetical protein OXC91_02010, partial [Rhodobacteraceae bacterium]|nr:hypothetical protein [Paracoccaceae bacterium]